MFDGGYLSTLRQSDETMKEYPTNPIRSPYTVLPSDTYHSLSTTPSEEEPTPEEYEEEEEEDKFFSKCPKCGAGVSSCNCTPVNFVCTRCDWKHITHTHLDVVPIKRK